MAFSNCFVLQEMGNKYLTSFLVYILETPVAIQDHLMVCILNCKNLESFFGVNSVAKHFDQIIIQLGNKPHVLRFGAWRSNTNVKHKPCSEELWKVGVKCVNMVLRTDTQVIEPDDVELHAYASCSWDIRSK